MLSILIPTYNFHVVDLVSTLKKQAIEAKVPFEILVLDDASTKKEFISKNQQITEMAHCFYDTNKTNLGRTQTRHKLAEKAKYKWLLFLDADVFPKYDDFIERFVEYLSDTYQLLVGGIIYKKQKPEKKLILRWKYGLERESLSLQKRKLINYQSIISGCLLIKKDIFLAINIRMLQNNYGMDIYFQKLLRNQSVSVLHIDNPVYHLGLETSDTFIKKSLAAVKTTYILEKQGHIEHDFRALQKSYLKLKKMGLLSIFNYIISKFKPKMERNFLSNHPNLFWFDLYRLNYFIELKRNDHA